MKKQEPIDIGQVLDETLRGAQRLAECSEKAALRYGEKAKTKEELALAGEMCDKAIEAKAFVLHMVENFVGGPCDCPDCQDEGNKGPGPTLN